MICGGPGVSDAYYCKECTIMEKDVCIVCIIKIVYCICMLSFDCVGVIFQRDGCPKIVNLGSAKTDLFYERKKYGFKKR